jgi:predicted nucleic acid-binding protein
MNGEATGVCLDASVLVALLVQERGWQAARRLMARPDVRCVAPGAVLTETVYVARRRGNQAGGGEIWEALSALGLTVETPSAADLLRAAELVESSAANPGPAAPQLDTPATLSLGDALALAVSERLGHAVVTRDTYWKWLADQGLTSARVVLF